MVLSVFRRTRRIGLVRLGRTRLIGLVRLRRTRLIGLVRLRRTRLIVYLFAWFKEGILLQPFETPFPQKMDLFRGKGGSKIQD